MPTGAVAPGGRGRRVWNTTRFETWKPSTFSAGYDAHQATKALDLPASLRMFHRALTLRKRLVIGTRRPVASSIAWKSATPWTSGPTPVTIVVHNRGEIIGSYERSGPCAPPFARRARLGSRPARISGSIVSQSAPSRPRTTTRPPVDSAVGAQAASA